MQIGNHLVTGYDNNLQEQVTVGHAQNVEQTSAGKSSVDLSGLNEGAVFRGEVLDIVGDKVTISLENQAKLMARLQAGVELGVGDKLLFSVKENTSKQILLKPMFDSIYSAQTQVLEKALDIAGLSPTEKNFTVAKELMDAGMPVDKGSIVNILSQSMKYEGTSLRTLVSLTKMNIPVTEENITQFERYENMQHQLMGDISETADAMADFTRAFSQNVDGKTLLTVANEITDLFVKDNMLPLNMDSSVDEGILSDGKKVEGEMSQAPQPADGEDVMKAAPDMQDADGVSDSRMPDREPMIEQGVQTLIRQMNISSNEDVSAAKDGMLKLADAMQKTNVSDSDIVQTFLKSQSEETLLKNVLQTLEKSDVPQDMLQHFLQNDSFRNLMSEVIKKGFSLNPQQMKDPKEIDDLYESLLKNTKKFDDIICSHGGDTKGFQQDFQNMRQNLNFMNQLNQQMIYAQMPITLSNRQTNSELYIYADKGKLQQKKDSISVMLHLDMDHLGATDVKVTLTGSNVHARFYLNDQESVDIVADNMKMLAGQLADRGFSLTNEVVKRQPADSINKVVDEVVDENAERSIKRYTFDART